MDIVFLLLTVAGLALFEIIISIDNAIINAQVLSTMSKKARRWFLLWGIVIAVFLVRGMFPWLIVWAANPSLGPIGAFTASLSGDPDIAHVIEQSSPLLLTGGGVFLVFLFFHWLFLEPKSYGIRGEKFFHHQGVWFFAVVSIFLAAVTWLAINVNPMMAFSAVIGSTAFFIVHGFKENAEKAEKEMIESKGSLSDLSKILYLEVIDMTFSIDGVVGAFAFTLIVPLIIIGNGMGAIIVRQLTVSNIERVARYKYLKNGAMYSILILGIVMLLDSFGTHIPAWASPISTFAIVGWFFYKSKKELNSFSRKSSKPMKIRQ